MDIWIYIIVALSLGVSLVLMFSLAKHFKEQRTLFILFLLSVIFIETGLTLGLWLSDNAASNILLYDAGVLIAFSLIMLVVYLWKQKQEKKTKLNTKITAFLGIIVGMASVLMILGFPVIPGFLYLKVEFSALIIFMTLLWFDFKTAVIVSLLTNILHFLMPGTPPLIPLLDEMVNFLATMIFILPTAIFLKKHKLSEPKSNLSILWFSILGVASTTVLMVLFNQYINLPLIYNIDMTFTQVLTVFGIFNLIKWGLNAILIILTWKRFYSIRSSVLNQTS